MLLLSRNISHMICSKGSVTSIPFTQLVRMFLYYDLEYIIEGNDAINGFEGP